jgi:hypothetical protein
MLTLWRLPTISLESLSSVRLLHGIEAKTLAGRPPVAVRQHAQALIQLQITVNQRMKLSAQTFSSTACQARRLAEWRYQDKPFCTERAL